MVHHVLISVSDHGTASIPPFAAHDVHGLGEKGVRAAHCRPDVQVVRPVLNRDVERVPARVEIGHDCIASPVSVSVDHVAAVAVLQQVGIEPSVFRPRQWVWTNTDFGFG